MITPPGLTFFSLPWPPWFINCCLCLLIGSSTKVTHHWFLSSDLLTVGVVRGIHWWSDDCSGLHLLRGILTDENLFDALNTIKYQLTLWRRQRCFFPLTWRWWCFIAEIPSLRGIEAPAFYWSDGSQSKALGVPSLSNSLGYLCRGQFKRSCCFASSTNLLSLKKIRLS